MEKATEGYILKSKSAGKISTEDLNLINKLTRRDFSEEEVYVFTVALCDNDIDRDFERFTNESLEKLAELYVGKTGILDHKPLAENQTARIFSCKVESITNKNNKLKEPYKRLIAKAYMPKCKKNNDIILSIDSGIKKEVSVGFAIENKFCSICGKDQNVERCVHLKGKRYKKGIENEICYVILENPTDAYEWSFVAIPAQKEAGVVKKLDKIESKENEEKEKPLKKSIFNTLEEKEENMPVEMIIKNLNIGQSLHITETEAENLFITIKSLKANAQIGETYKKELKNEVLRLSVMVQPEFDLNLMKAVADKLSLEELKSFKKFFDSKMSKIMPEFSQLAPDNNEFKKENNVKFLI